MLIVLTMKPISAGPGGAQYLIEGAGCSQHAGSPESYYINGAAAGEGLGVWHGAGVEALGREDGAEITESDVRRVFGDLVHPDEYAAILAEKNAEIEQSGLQGFELEDARSKAHEDAVAGASLGDRPRQYRSPEQRAEDRIGKMERSGSAIEPEQRARIVTEERIKGTKQANGYFDLTFSAPKSVSLLHAGFLMAGDTESANKVLAAHREGMHAAIEHLVREAGGTRAGYHGRGRGGDKPSTGIYLDAKRWVGAEFTHYTSREGDPQLHTHHPVLNRVPVIVNGKEEWLTLDSRQLYNALPGAKGVYEGQMFVAMERDLPVVSEMRPDGLSREIKGIGQEERDAWSTRRAQVVEARDRYAEEFRQQFGREPTPYELTKISEVATLDTRRGKESPMSVPELIASYRERAIERQTTQLPALAARAVEVGGAAKIEAALNGGRPPINTEQVIEQALSAVQTKQASWTRGDLIRHLNTELPNGWQPGDVAFGAKDVDEALCTLADQALTGQYGVTQVAGHQVLDAPEGLRRESDGRSVYRPTRDEFYARQSHVDKELGLLARTTQAGAPAVSELAAQLTIEKHELSGDQAAAVRGSLTDGRQISVIVGPAGAGKTRTQRAIADAWKDAGGKVVGIAPSNVAATVLGLDAGIETTNTAKFVANLDRIESGRAGDPALTLGPGMLVILDEAGMGSTEHAHRIAEAAEAAGAKTIWAGDYAQVGSPEAGGMLQTMASRGPVYELEEVRRFRSADGEVRGWEAQASLRLRSGDVSVLSEYRDRGKIFGGSYEYVTGQFVERYSADVIAGRDGAIVCSTNETAAEVSAQVRARLVELGQVVPEGTPLVDGNRAGVGDVIQTRENDHALIDSQGYPVYNRFIYEVTGRHEDGALDVCRITDRNPDGSAVYGGTVTLPADYVGQDVALSYAGTQNAVQGRTLMAGGGYSLIDGQSSRNGAYVGLTRSSADNVAGVVCVVPGDEHNPQSVRQDPVDFLAGVLQRDGTEQSAVETLFEDLDHARSGPAVAPQWSLTVDQWHRERTDAILQDVLSPADYDRLKAEGGDMVMRRVREAELDGHDVRNLLTEATAASMTDARSFPALLTDRIDKHVQAREPENAAATDWLSRTPHDMVGTRGEFAREAAEKMQTRQAELGLGLAETPEPWALDRLGPVPEEMGERMAWARRAGVVEFYRETYGVQDTSGTVIGPAPERGAVEQRAAWRDAYAALGQDESQRYLVEADDATLRRYVAEYEREQQWAPAYVADELRDSSLARDRYAAGATVAGAEASRAMDPAERDRLSVKGEAYGELADALGERASAYTEIYEARQAWYGETQETRERAEAARMELQRRGIDIDQEPRGWMDRLGEKVDALGERVSGWLHRGESPEWEQESLFDLSPAQEAQQRFLEEQRDLAEAEPAAVEDQAAENTAAVDVAEVEQPEAQAQAQAPQVEQEALFDLTPEQIEQQRFLQEQRELAEAEPEQEQQPAPEPGEQNLARVGEQLSPMIADLGEELDKARGAVSLIGERHAEEEEEQETRGIEFDEEQREADQGIGLETEDRGRGGDDALELALER